MITVQECGEGPGGTPRDAEAFLTFLLQPGGGRARLTCELALSADQCSRAEAQPTGGTDGTGVTSQKDLLPTMEEPQSLYSVLVIHMSLKVESEHRMEPPTQAPYME